MYIYIIHDPYIYIYIYIYTYIYIYIDTHTYINHQAHEALESSHNYASFTAPFVWIPFLSRLTINMPAGRGPSRRTSIFEF